MKKKKGVREEEQEEVWSSDICCGGVLCSLQIAIKTAV